MGPSTLEIVEWGTFIATLLITVAGMPSCLHILRTKSTKNYPYIVFVIASVNSTCLAVYGYLIDNPGFIKMNMLGVFFNFIYAASYVYVTKNKMKSLKMPAVGLCYFAAVYVYLTKVVEPNDVTERLGLINTIATIIFLISPLLEVGEFVEAKSCDGMSLSLLCGGTLCSVMWFIYGKLLDDPYIYLPNIPGLFTNVVYFSLILLYGFGEKTKTS